MTEQIDAGKWCAETLAEWESVTKELMEVQFSDTSSSLLHKALVTRTKEKKAISDIKAAAAALVQQLMRDAGRGAVTLEVPEAQLDVRLTWNERLPSTT